MRKFNSVTTGQILTNIILLVMIALTFISMAIDNSGGFGLEKNRRDQVNSVCIEGDYDECYDFGERAVIEISKDGDPNEDGEVILRIRKVQ